jgi:hypothetical protein
VYVDPERYAAHDQKGLRDVGRAVGKLNKVLPKRQFVLIGPGRWGSRGDIKLGVPVTYSDINNTAMLVEVARRRGGYVPELSFGTHFFQDLVEADIRYLPLYPDEPGNAFDEVFLARSRSILPELLPEFASLADTVRVIDVPRETDGRVLTVLMNEELGEAVAVLTAPGGESERAAPGPVREEPPAEDHSRWRRRMAERLAERLEGARYGVKAAYLFGSTKNGTAGPGSDIDLIVHVDGLSSGEARFVPLHRWFQGWSEALAEANYLRTGYLSAGLLDVHFVTDEDLRRGTSFAAKIGAVTDAAQPLTLGG